jgi:hypothetical protein
MVDSIEVQKTMVARFRNAGNYPAMYHYIARQVADRPLGMKMVSL